ncbi:hypothetical protein AB1Y20_020521 [Prymnesium parvum]|uniref:Uncharacterized protein n=1 Tax=Prymnesium parvum TaxID=97485 RepID=A0AB34JXM5_PRYPA
MRTLLCCFALQATSGLQLAPTWSTVPRTPARTIPCRMSAEEVISAAVSLSTFAPQPFWLLMIAAPHSPVTRKVMGSVAPILGLALVHLAIVVISASQPDGTAPIAIFADVFDPSKSQLDGMRRLFEVSNFVAEEWPHVLIWDLFVGRAIWLDGIARGVPTWFSLTVCNGIGPPGLLFHIGISLALGKGLPPMAGPALDVKERE